MIHLRNSAHTFRGNLNTDICLHPPTYADICHIQLYMYVCFYVCRIFHFHTHTRTLLLMLTKSILKHEPWCLYFNDADMAARRQISSTICTLMRQHILTHTHTHKNTHVCKYQLLKFAEKQVANKGFASDLKSWKSTSTNSLQGYMLTFTHIEERCDVY